MSKLIFETASCGDCSGSCGGGCGGDCGSSCSCSSGNNDINTARALLAGDTLNGVAREKLGELVAAYDSNGSLSEGDSLELSRVLQAVSQVQQ